MDNKKLAAIAIAVAVVVIILIVSVVVLNSNQKDNGSITGMYNISEYRQYYIENGEFGIVQSGDGPYDSEFIEITDCSDGTFSGYCCLGDKDPKHYPILGTYDSQTGMIQYVCSYGYPTEGLYDWVHGTIVDGVMRLSGITFGNDESYYGSFQFVFVKEGHKAQKVTFEPILDAGDSYSSFKVLKSIGGDESEYYAMSFDAIETSNGLYRIGFKNPGSSESIELLGSAIGKDLMIGIGYEDGEPFSVLISKQGGYVQVNREYAEDGQFATWTAYLTKDGNPVQIKSIPDLSKSFNGFSTSRSADGKLTKKLLDISVKKLSDSLVGVMTDGSSITYGNIIPCSDGYVVAISESHTEGSKTVYHLGFAYLDIDMKSLYYSKMYMSVGELNVIFYRGSAI